MVADFNKYFDRLKVESPKFSKIGRNSLGGVNIIPSMSPVMHYFLKDHFGLDIMVAVQ